MYVKLIHIKNCFCFKEIWLPSQGEFGKFNCFIGRNDRGKSLVLKILDMVFNGSSSSIFQGIFSSGSKYDCNLNTIGINLINGRQIGRAEIRIFLKLEKEYNDFEEIINRVINNFPFLNRARDLLMEYKIDYENEMTGRFYRDNIQIGNLSTDEFVDINNFGGFADNFRQILNNILENKGYILIPAVRKMDRDIDRDVDLNWNPDLDGSGSSLAIYQYQNNLILGKRGVVHELRGDISKLSEFQTLSAYAEQNVRNVEYDEIPQNFVGDATKQITLAILNLKLYNKNVVGFEEPESHLHPGKQKEFINYLKKHSQKNSIQFFITTHSPFLIDHIDQYSIFHFKKTDDGINPFRVESDDDLWALLKDLDVKPHDFLLSDMVIFTEGPSDRKILKIFAEKMGYDFDNSNISFIDFSGDTKNLDVESLLNINRSYKIVICSHVGNELKEKEINEFKEKMEKSGQISKLTIFTRREIENYLSPRAIELQFGFSRGVLKITESTDVISLVSNTPNTEGVKKGWGSKPIKGSKVALLMEKDEIDVEIQTFLRMVFDEIIKDKDFPS